MIKMKDSGIEWIGVVPKNWEIERLQWHLYEIVEKNDPIQTTQVLSLTNKKGVIPYEEKGNQGNTAKENYDGYKIAYPDTIVANSMNILIGSVGYSKLYGCVSPVYYVFKEKNNNDLRFINYIMQTSQFQCELRKCANGILEIRLRVSSSDILKQKCAFPNLQTQTLIADYLDEKCIKIDKIIEKQQAVIEKLKEYKLSVITEAVTKGLNPDVEMKDSGLKWVDKIPVSWENCKMISILSMRVVDGPHESPELFDDGIPYISATAIENGKINFNLMRGYISKEYCDLCDLRYKPQLHDILVIKLGASTGQVGIVETEERFNIWVPLAAVRCNHLADPYFVYYAFKSDYFWKQMELSWTFGTQQTLGVKTIERLRIMVPPLEEQHQIAKYLKDKCSSIDSIIEKRQNIVEKLTEYKKSLIYEVVTGKKVV